MIAKKLLHLALWMTLLASQACSFAGREETFEKDAGAWFTFTGNVDEAYVTVLDEGKPIWKNLEVEEDTRYAIKPGTFEVIILREGKQVVYRRFFLGDGSITEVRIP